MRHCVIEHAYFWTRGGFHPSSFLEADACTGRGYLGVDASEGCERIQVVLRCFRQVEGQEVMKMMTAFFRGLFDGYDDETFRRSFVVCLLVRHSFWTSLSLCHPIDPQHSGRHDKNMIHSPLYGFLSSSAFAHHLSLRLTYYSFFSSF